MRIYNIDISWMMNTWPSNLYRCKWTFACLSLYLSWNNSSQPSSSHSRQQSCPSPVGLSAGGNRELSDPLTTSFLLCQRSQYHRNVNLVLEWCLEAPESNPYILLMRNGGTERLGDLARVRELVNTWSSVELSFVWLWVYLSVNY